ncbi:hypothetical protein NEF87_000364 [Candidatus Lokiarchaeum ossiferum]|uniref:Uncharacterized protein n=1 Tax=Candidatus Lokiarchaeum ossiferum TaxID=2951803 RepID=A0ABY6HKM5_9ARCH|nr:hypothetical protein NEF87_000364 [Candidatus Lokiarchaeum sp. B-35]
MKISQNVNKLDFLYVFFVIIGYFLKYYLIMVDHSIVLITCIIIYILSEKNLVNDKTQKLHDKWIFPYLIFSTFISIFSIFWEIFDKDDFSLYLDLIFIVVEIASLIFIFLKYKKSTNNELREAKDLKYMKKIEKLDSFYYWISYYLRPAIILFILFICLISAITWTNMSFSSFLLVEFNQSKLLHVIMILLVYGYLAFFFITHFSINLTKKKESFDFNYNIKENLEESKDYNTNSELFERGILKIGKKSIPITIFFYFPILIVDMTLFLTLEKDLIYWTPYKVIPQLIIPAIGILTILGMILSFKDNRHSFRIEQMLMIANFIMTIIAIIPSDFYSGLQALKYMPLSVVLLWIVAFLQISIYLAHISKMDFSNRSLIILELISIIFCLFFWIATGAYKLEFSAGYYTSNLLMDFVRNLFSLDNFIFLFVLGSLIEILGVFVKKPKLRKLINIIQLILLIGYIFLFFRYSVTFNENSFFSWPSLHLQKILGVLMFVSTYTSYIARIYEKSATSSKDFRKSLIISILLVGTIIINFYSVLNLPSDIFYSTSAISNVSSGLLLMQVGYSILIISTTLMSFFYNSKKKRLKTKGLVIWLSVNIVLQIFQMCLCIFIYQFIFEDIIWYMISSIIVLTFWIFTLYFQLKAPKEVVLKENIAIVE